MLRASIQLYRNAYSGLSAQMWWLAVVTLVNRSGTMVLPFLTVYLTHSGFTLSQAGYIMACFGTGGILGSYLGGKLTDRFGFHYVQLFSLTLNGLMFFVLGQMHTFAQFAVCIFVLSLLGEAFRPANAAAIAAFSNDANRTRCYSLNRLAINLGWTVGPAVGGILASLNYSLLFWVDGFTCIAAALILYFFLTPSGDATATRPERSEVRSSPFSDRIFLRGMFYVFLVGVCFFQLFTILPVFYKNEVHLNEAGIGWLLALNGLLIALVEMVIVYKLENRRNAVVYIMAGALLMGFSYLVLSIAPLVSVALLGIILITFGEMLLFPFINNFWVSRSVANNRGQYAAVYAMSFALASIVAPTLASQIVTMGGFKILWVINFFICGIAALGFLQLKKQLHDRIHEDNPDQVGGS